MPPYNTCQKGGIAYEKISYCNDGWSHDGDVRGSTGLTTDQTGKVRSRVTTLEDGTVIYKVKFTFDGQKHTYQINATTGEIIDKVVE